MGIVLTFQDRANVDDLYIADVDLGEFLGFRARYIKFLRSAAKELDVRIGVNETERGLQLGFEDLAQYQAVMELTEPKFEAIVKTMNRAIARYGAGCRTDLPDRLARLTAHDEEFDLST